MGEKFGQFQERTELCQLSAELSKYVAHIHSFQGNLFISVVDSYAPFTLLLLDCVLFCSPFI